MLGELLVRAARTWPHSGVHHVDDDTFQSYPDLLGEALRLLGALRAKGLKPGDEVGLRLDSSRDLIGVFWACVFGGFVPCPLPPPPTDGDRWAAQLAHIDEVLDRPLLVMSRDELSGGESVHSVHQPAPQDLALLLLTSGSTGKPKAVRLTHAQLLAGLEAKRERLKVAVDDVTMNWIAFDHVAAIEFHLLPMYVGARQLHVSPATVLSGPEKFAELVERHRVTVTFTPNFLLRQLHAGDLSSLRHVISGGEAVVCATARAFLERFGLSQDVFVPGFGMTETFAGCVHSVGFPDLDDGHEFAEAGVPLDGLEMRVEDGELQLRGPVVFDGYHNNAKATAEAFTLDGWFRTGDLATVHNGRLRLEGRRKDSIVVNSVNYFSHDIETVLAELDGIARGCVAAFPTRRPGSDTEQLVVAFSPVSDDLVPQLLVAVRTSVVLHWGFRPVLVLPLPEEEMPRTSLGKLRRTSLRERLEAGDFAVHEARVAELTRARLGAHASPGTGTEVLLTEIFARLFDVAPWEISATASFFDLGGTSVEVLRLRGEIRRWFGIEDFSVLSIMRALSVRQLARMLEYGHDQTYDPVVQLQGTGDGTPLFFVHPGVGEVLVFVTLAGYFAGERPFYALRARGFGAGEKHFGSYAEMVDSYVAAVRAKQPAGPYAIAGYSFGGLVAFDVAKGLEAQGQEVRFVGVVNVQPHMAPRIRKVDFAWSAVNFAHHSGLITKEQAEELRLSLCDVPEDRIVAHLHGLAPRRRLAELDLDLARMTEWIGLARELIGLADDYEPSGDVRSITVFHALPLEAGETEEEWVEHVRRWDDFSREPNRYVKVAGEHHTLMGPEHVAAFQQAFRVELRRSLDFT